MKLAITSASATGTGPSGKSRPDLEASRSTGLTQDPGFAVGDGELGFWKALPQVWPGTRSKRCGRRTDDELRAFEPFIENYEAKFPKAVAWPA